MQQALRDVIAWVEDGVEPPSSASYTHEPTGAVRLPDRAAERAGIQPVPVISVDGQRVASAKPGQVVTLSADVEVPQGTGRIIAVDWDLTGEGAWVAEDGVDGSQSTLRLTRQHTYDDAGTYWPTVRVTSHRDGDIAASTCLVSNLAQARVDVG